MSIPEFLKNIQRFGYGEGSGDMGLIECADGEYVMFEDVETFLTAFIVNLEEGS